MKKIRKSFNELGLASVAVGLTLGNAVNEFLNSTVDSLLMPLVGYFIAEDAWDKDFIVIGEIHLKWGVVAADAIHMAIVFVVVYHFVGLFKENKEENIDSR